MEELVGVFYFEKEEKIHVKKLPFIIDDSIEWISNFDYIANIDDYIEFQKNSLVLNEVKNRFPGTNRCR